MFRSPSVASHRYDDLSSPDPLAASLDDGNSTGSSDAHSNRKSAPRQSSTTTSETVTKHTRTSSQMYDRLPPSPFRTVSEQNLSPWKIRVTVEAEPEDPGTDGNAPMSRAKTRTTKIPLQSDSHLTDCLESSARGRKTLPNTAKSKRDSTPVRGGRNASRIRRQSVTDLDIIPLGDDAEEDDWLRSQRSQRKPRSPRKSATAAISRTQTSSPSKSRPIASATEVDIRLENDAGNEQEGIQQQIVLRKESPEIKKLELKQISIRPKAPSTKSRPNRERTDQDLIASQNVVNSTTKTQLQTRKVSANSTMSYPTPSPTSSYHGDSDHVGADHDEPAQDHGTDGFDTMLESEGFTMIDLQTLPSVKQHLSSPQSEEQASTTQTQHSPLPAVLSRLAEECGGNPIGSKSLAEQQGLQYPTLRLDESEISSTVPSSPSASERSQSLLKVSSSHRPGFTRKVTPQLHSSPKFPSPPRHEVRLTPRHQHRGSAGALFAGIALQDVLSPVKSGDSAGVGSEMLLTDINGHESGDRLFQGYDSGTQKRAKGWSTIWRRTC